LIAHLLCAEAADKHSSFIRVFLLGEPLGD
jgi:hypothetical protein